MMLNFLGIQCKPEENQDFACKKGRLEHLTICTTLMSTQYLTASPIVWRIASLIPSNKIKSATTNTTKLENKRQNLVLDLRFFFFFFCVDHTRNGRLFRTGDKMPLMWCWNEAWVLAKWSYSERTSKVRWFLSSRFCEWGIWGLETVGNVWSRTCCPSSENWKYTTLVRGEVSSIKFMSPGASYLKIPISMKHFRRYQAT